MKTSISTASAIALVAALSSSTWAQDDTNMDSGTQTEMATDADATAAPAGADDAEYGADSTYLEIPPSVFVASELELGDITEQSQVQIMTLSELASGGSDLTVLDDDVAQNSDALEKLRGNIEGNAAITGKLEAEGYALADVVSLQHSDDMLTIYVDDRD